MSAVISTCGNYRYWLERDVGRNPLVFLMLNPSTADAELDDPTIRRCRRFSSDNKYSGIIVVNLYALRSTKPENLWKHHDPVGELNNYYIMKACNAGDVCLAYGTNPKPDRVAEVLSLLNKLDVTPKCLGKTKDNFPRHPLYIKADQPIINY